METRSADAFGRAFLDWARGGEEPEVLQRRDGQIEVGAGPGVYLAAVHEWPRAERLSLEAVSGRVVDLGCGPGRVSLELQTLGHDVTGVDASPLALRAARLRGVERARLGTLEEYWREIGRVDTTILFGNNLGLFGTPARLRRTLTRWARHAAEGSRMLVESTDPMSGGAPIVDRALCRDNVSRGRAAGQCRVRVWYDRSATGWFDWLFLSASALRGEVRGTGWRIAHVYVGARDEPYVALLERATRAGA